MIINILFRLLLTFNATSLLIIIFLVQKKYTLFCFFQNVQGFQWLNSTPHILSYLFYFLIPIILTKASLILSVRLGKDEFKKDEVISVEYANNSFLPSYLGYFFVALSINDWMTLFFVYGLLFVFTFLSQALYFNPLFLVFRYEFYNIKTKTGASIFLISPYRYKVPQDVVVPVAFRINNYTFIERK